MIYAIGFIIAVVMYILFAYNRGWKINAFQLIIGILTGLASWLGVIVVLILMSITPSNSKE